MVVGWHDGTAATYCSEVGNLVEILSQAEIEALLSSISAEGTEGDQPAGRPGPAANAPSSTPDYRPPSKNDKAPIAYELYDFRRPDKLSKDQLRTLQMLHETFARLFASSLSAYLRTSTHIDLISVEQVPYEEYMRQLNQSIVNVFGMPPLAGQAILEIEFSAVLSMIDRLLGGPGNMAKPSTVLTEIEQALTESIVDKALRDFRSAWEGIAHFTPKRERIETQSQFIQIVPPSDIVVSILFELRIGDLRGAMSLCLPYTTLKPISGKMSAQRWFASAKKAHGQNAATLARRIATTRVTCTCRLGKGHITVGDLVALRAGDTLVLDRKAAEEVELLVGGTVKFRGRPGTSGKKVAVHISRVCVDDTNGVS